jgi:hypothetical protein
MMVNNSNNTNNHKSLNTIFADGHSVRSWFVISTKQSLKIPKGKSEYVNRKTDTMAKRL